MPRQPRIDIPESLYHIIGRGIERRKIFLDDADYENFLCRLKQSLEKTDSKCLAYALMENHFHLLIMRGQRPLAELMRRLMTGYAVNFNLRHGRIGHLFQNRYKAILCEYDAYFLELVAYIHLNPLRAGLVKDLEGLRKYKWCGHGALMGEFEEGFLAQDDVLEKFEDNLKRARRKYEMFMEERIGKFKPGELSSGGLRKSLGGKGFQTLLKEEEGELSDARILGRGEFVETILGPRKIEIDQGGISLDEIAKLIRTKTGIGIEEIKSRSRKRDIVKARALYCFLALEKSKVKGTELMRDLSLTSGAISHLVSMGREIDKKENN